MTSEQSHVMPSFNEHITAQEAAERLDYTVQHVRRLLRNGDLEGRKIGRDWLVGQTSVAEFAMKRENLHLPLDGAE